MDRKRAFVHHCLKTRKCGTCHMCCVVLASIEPEITKPAFTPCRYLCDEGCGIQDHKPAICRAWKCLWQLGMTNTRPDLLGGYISFSDPADPTEVEVFIPGGKITSAIMDEIAALGRKTPISTLRVVYPEASHV